MRKFYAFKMESVILVPFDIRVMSGKVRSGQIQGKKWFSFSPEAVAKSS